MKTDYDVIVIGGGITGLTTVFYLVRGGLKVALIEKSNRLGGQIASFSKDGFVYESGPNTGILNNVEVVELFNLVKESARLEIAHSEAKKRLILHKGVLKSLPSSMWTGLKTPLFSFRDKFNVLLEPFRSPGENPNETVEGLVLRRLGKTILEYAVDPFVSGIYAGDPSKLVTRFALPKLYNLENTYGSFIKGSIKRAPMAKELKNKGVTKDVFSFKDGLESLPKAVANYLEDKAEVILGTENVVISKNQNGIEVSFKKGGEEISLTCPKVVTTTGAYTLPDLLPEIKKEELSPITSLEYAKVIEVALGYKSFPKKLNAFGGLIPSKENRKVLGILFPSACFSNRAPEGGGLLSVFIGGMKHPEMFDLSDDELRKAVLYEVNSIMGINLTPDLMEIFRYPHAIPQYYASSECRYEAIRKIEEKMGGLIIGGNLKDGIGLSDRIRQGKSIADKILTNG